MKPQKKWGKEKKFDDNQNRLMDEEEILVQCHMKEH